MFALLSDKLNQIVLTEVRRRNPQYLRDDRFAWLNESVVIGNGGTLEHIPWILARRLSAYYDEVVAFHGCRPVSLESYQFDGLKPSNTESLRHQARELFGDTGELEKAIADLQGGYESHNHGKIWLCITKKSFLCSHHDHFLLNGSEYLSGIATRVRGDDIVRNIGTPTIIECAVPVTGLKWEFWAALSDHIIEDWFSRFLRPHEKRPLCTLCVNITETIPPEKILKFHRFREVRHRHTWRDEHGRQMHGESVKLAYQPVESKIAPGLN
jgi:hypothetical protein